MSTVSDLIDSVFGLVTDGSVTFLGAIIPPILILIFITGSVVAAFVLLHRLIRRVTRGA